MAVSLLVNSSKLCGSCNKVTRSKNRPSSRDLCKVVRVLLQWPLLPAPKCMRTKTLKRALSTWKFRTQTNPTPTASPSLVKLRMMEAFSMHQLSTNPSKETYQNSASLKGLENSTAMFTNHLWLTHSSLHSKTGCWKNLEQCCQTKTSTACRILKVSISWSKLHRDY